MNSTPITDGRAATTRARHSEFRIFMDTAVAVDVWARPDDAEVDGAIRRAFAWFAEVEATCTRFDRTSELARLSATAGQPVRVSVLLLQVLRFALTVAAATDGAFDPTVGDTMARHGFTRNHRTGRHMPVPSRRGSASFRDVVIDERRGVVTLLRPLTLDLGGVAKGLALDLAGQELRACGPFAISAGGDLLFGGSDPGGGPWEVDVRHPREHDAALLVLRVHDRAVCTSGGYERPRPDGSTGHHLLNPRTGETPASLLSATVIAPQAMLADAMATVAFVMGPDASPLLEAHSVDACFVRPSLDTVQTSGFRRWLA